jgi:2,4-dienoyl-CoA reductase-like NADH-dependent reductase (Old Yellow Enzyme family)
MSAVQDLSNLARSLSLDLPLSEDFSSLAEPVRLGEFVAPNSLCIQPMEGCDGEADGSPGPLTERRYDRFARGGGGLIWAEAIAVAPEGRANPRQLWLHEGSFERLAALIARTRRLATERFGKNFRPFMVAQLTHSGRYSKPGEKPQPQIAQHDPNRGGRMNLPHDYPLVSDDYLDRLPEKFLQAARLALRAGFDAVDLKACHGYLISELLSSHTRTGKYGGSFENRVRLLLTIIDLLRADSIPGSAIATRLGVFDAIPHPYGWGVNQSEFTKPDLSEPLRLIGLLAERGIRLVNVTIASPYYNPHYGRPFNKPARGAYPSPENPLVGVMRLVELAGTIQKAFPDLAIVGTGYSWLAALLPHVAAGVKQRGLATFLGAGRMAFAYPDFAADILERGGLNEKKVCIACSACTQIMRDGGTTGCPVRDKEIYGPIYHHGLSG